MATYEVRIDTDRSGLFDADEDVTADVVAQGRAPGGLLLSTERGHDQTRVLSPPIAGSAQFILDNNAGTYSPGTDYKGGRPLRVRGTHSGTTYDLWRGYIDHPVQAPPDSINREVYVQAFGSLARLAGKTVSTALYSSIRTGEAIEYLLDAAGFAQNLPAYLDSLGPAGGWNLASTSGADPDTSGNGNDAAITLGSGVRGDTAIEDGGTETTDFDGADTRYSVTADAAINNHFATGGLVLALLNADSDGESDTGIIATKGYEFYVSDQSGSDMRLQFVQGFSTTPGSWRTTDRVITVGANYLVAVYYDRVTGTSADPTMWVFDLDAKTYDTLTVGDGLTEVSTPVGSVTTDEAVSMTIGSASGGSRCFEGNIGCIRVFGDLGDAAYWEPLLVQAAVRGMDAPRHIDAGLTTMEWWWLDNEDALAAIEALKNTEGPGAALYEDATGAIVFKDRHHRNTLSASTTAQETYSGAEADGEPLLTLPVFYDPGFKDVVNDCAIDVVTRTAQSLAEVWAFGDTIIIAAGETKTFTARGSNPWQNAVAPSSGGGDYTVVTGSISSPTIDQTSGTQITISIYSAAGATITGLRLRAEEVTVTSTTVARNSQDTSASQDEYGTHPYRLATRKEIQYNTAVDFCDAIVTQYQDGRPYAEVQLAGHAASERMVEAMTREVSDRIHVTVGDYIDADFHVENIRHEVYAPASHFVMFGLEEASSVVSYFVLGTSELNSADVLAF